MNSSVVVLFLKLEFPAKTRQEWIICVNLLLAFYSEMYHESCRHIPTPYIANKKGTAAPPVTTPVNAPRTQSETYVVCMYILPISSRIRRQRISDLASIRYNMWKTNTWQLFLMAWYVVDLASPTSRANTDMKRNYQNHWNKGSKCTCPQLKALHPPCSSCRHGNRCTTWHRLSGSA